MGLFSSLSGPIICYLSCAVACRATKRGKEGQGATQEAEPAWGKHLGILEGFHLLSSEPPVHSLCLSISFCVLTVRMCVENVLLGITEGTNEYRLNFRSLCFCSAFLGQASEEDQSWEVTKSLFLRLLLVLFFFVCCCFLPLTAGWCVMWSTEFRMPWLGVGVRLGGEGSWLFCRSNWAGFQVISLLKIYPKEIMLIKIKIYLYCRNTAGGRNRVQWLSVCSGCNWKV